MQTKTANRSAGRPRRQGVEETVLAAAVALAGDEGYAGATVDAVAARAGVAKTTVYRRWPSKEALAVDALAAALDLPPADPGGPEPDATLCRAVRRLAAQMQTTPVRALLGGLLTQAMRDPETRARLRSRFREPFLREALADPAGDADLDPAAVDLAFDLVVGTLLHRLATVGDVSQAELEAILGAAVGLLSGRPASG